MTGKSLRTSLPRAVLVLLPGLAIALLAACGGSGSKVASPQGTVIPPGFNDVILGKITPTVIAATSSAGLITVPIGFHRISVLNDGIPGSYLTTGQGWVLIRMKPDWSTGTPPNANRAVFGWMKPGGKDYIELFYRPDGGIIAVRRAKGEGAGTQMGFPVVKGVEFDWLMSWTKTQVRIDADGSFTETVSNIASPDLTDAIRFEIGSALPFDDAMPGSITMCAFGRGTISAAEAKALHEALLAGPLSVPLIKSIAPTSDPTFAWDTRGPRGRTGECDP